MAAPSQSDLAAGVPASAKTCSRCRETLSLESFSRNRARRDGFGNYCRKCHAEAGHAFRNGPARETYLAKRREAERNRTEAQRSRIREQQRARTYGLTVDQLRALGDTCQVCSGPGGEVDHDHGCCPGVRSCGSCVRGLLCNHCNRMLGHASDDPNRLLAAAAYLMGSRSVERV